MQEKYKKLREPLKNEDIELRVGTVGAKGATLLLYKTARVDTKRLDDIFGGRWQRTHYIDNKGNVVCKISIFDEELKEWIAREDVGTESNTEKEKGAYSDAFKRAGFAWGVGVELYNSPFIHISCETTEKDKAGKKYYELKDRHYFNDVVVSKFEVINDDVFVEISKKGQMIYSNFKNNAQQQTPKEPVKQVAVQSNINDFTNKINNVKALADINALEKELFDNKNLTDNERNERKKLIWGKKQTFKINEKDLKTIQDLISDAELNTVNICNKYQIQALTELNYKQWFEVKKECDKIINDMN